MIKDWNVHEHRRNTDPKTSALAAAEAKLLAGKHMFTILGCLVEHGPMTADEIAQKIELQTHQINRRTSDLIRAGLIHDMGIRRAARSGRLMRVLMVT